MGVVTMPMIRRFDDIFHQEGRLISHSARCPDVPLVTFLRYAQGMQRVYWESSTASVTFAGVGAAAEFSADGADRFESIKAQLERLYREADISGPEASAVRVFGGFSFDARQRRDRAWAAFPDAYFIVPRYQLSRMDGQTWLTINRYVTDPTDEWEPLYEEHDALNEWLASATDEPPSLPALERLTPLVSQAEWTDAIEAVRAMIANGEAEKVVLARAGEARFAQPPDLLTALGNLARRYANTYRFLIEPRPGYAFYGATPELLVQIEDGRLHTAALAGSTRRGDTPETDAALGQALLESAKDQHEHRIVVDAIREQLEPLAAELAIPAEATLMKLANIQHLYTPISATLPADTHILDVVEGLHPTPALGGAPRGVALDAIAQLEPVARGWYGAPVGWIDHRGNGVFSVAIRSALSSGARTRFYAGAGIVGDSDAASEWQETRVKLMPMLSAHGIEGVDALTPSPAPTRRGEPEEQAK